MYQLSPDFQPNVSRKPGTCILGGGPAITGAGRTESGNFVSFDLSRLFLFDEPLIGIFQSASAEAGLTLASVSSSIANFGYHDTGFTLSAGLGF